jgi:hypothetical protein
LHCPTALYSVPVYARLVINARLREYFGELKHSQREITATQDYDDFVRLPSIMMYRDAVGGMSSDV